VQSTHERELAALGRIHTVAQAREAVEAAKRAGIENISVDLMLAIPHQTPHTLAQSIATVCEWGITHLSLYGLRIEDGTPFARVRDTLPLPDEDTEVQMYYDAVEQLESLGFAQYEISNFAKEDCACRHNLKYWHAEPYLGLGTAAHSFLDGQRQSIRCDLAAYLAAAQHGDFSGVTEWEAPLAAKTAQDEYVMLALRLREGVREADFAKRFDVDFASCYGEKLQALMKKELIKHQNGAWILPASVQYISNSILSELLDFQ
jgi:oxygen-independent coproporphyrinogen-3 oxidase